MPKVVNFGMWFLHRFSSQVSEILTEAFWTPQEWKTTKKWRRQEKNEEKNAKNLLGHFAHLGTAWCPSSKKHKMLKFMTGFDFLHSFVLVCNKRIITKQMMTDTILMKDILKSGYTDYFIVWTKLWVFMLCYKSFIAN